MKHIFDHIDSGDTKDPLRFFRGIANEYQLLIAIEKFMPNERETKTYTIQKAKFRKVNHDNISYEWTEILYADEQNKSKTAWEKNEFKTPLSAILIFETNKLKKLLIEFIYIHVEHVNELLTYLIYDLNKLILKTKESPTHEKHPIIREKLESIVDYVNTEYNDYLPTKNKLKTSALKKVKRKSFKGKIIADKDFKRLHALLEYQDPKFGTSQNDFIHALLFISKNIPLKNRYYITLGNKKTFSYLLKQLQKCNPIDFAKLEKSGKLYINENPFDAEAANEGAYGAPEHLMKIIDDWLLDIE